MGYYLETLYLLPTPVMAAYIEKPVELGRKAIFKEFEYRFGEVLINFSDYYWAGQLDIAAWDSLHGILYHYIVSDENDHMGEKEKVIFRVLKQLITALEDLPDMEDF